MGGRRAGIVETRSSWLSIVADSVPRHGPTIKTISHPCLRLYPGSKCHAPCQRTYSHQDQEHRVAFHLMLAIRTGIQGNGAQVNLITSHAAGR